MNNNSLSKAIEIINKSIASVIILPSNPSSDAVASAISLFLCLTKLGKNVNIVSSSQIQSDLVGVDKIQTNLAASGDNLVVSFPYTDGSIDKVDYKIQGNFFNLIITPRAGFQKLNPNQIKYSYSGGSFDTIITIDAPNLSALGEIYSNNQDQFQGKNIINIDRHLINSYFGVVNFVSKNASSTSELILKILQGLNCPIDKDIATNLYTGIVTATNNFSSYSVNADTFEASANLMKMGAQKKSHLNALNQPTNHPVINFEQQNVKPIQSIEKEPQTNEQKTPQDWLKPKIFRSGGLI